MQRNPLEISKSGFLQYLLIYIILQYAGGRVFAAIGSDQGYLITIILCVFLGAVWRNYLLRKNSYTSFITILGILCVMTMALTLGGLSVGTTLSLFSRFLVVYIAILIDKEKFVYRMVRLVYIMAVISLIEYAFISIVGADTAIATVFSHLYEIPCGHAWLRSSYGLFVIAFNFMDPTRNAYMYGEAGEYQAVLVMAAFLLLTNSEYFKPKQQRRYLVILFITLITVQSTTGYFALILLVMLVLFGKGNITNKYVKALVIAFVVIAGVYSLFFAGSESLIYTRFLNKFVSNEGIDFGVYTGADRVYALISYGALFVNDFFNVLIGMGYDGIVSRLGSFTCAGLINSLLMFGMIPNIYMYYNTFQKNMIFSKSKLESVVTIALMINMGLSQPDLFAITSIVMLCYPWISNLYTFNDNMVEA